MTLTPQQIAALNNLGGGYPPSPKLGTLLNTMGGADSLVVDTTADMLALEQSSLTLNDLVVVRATGVTWRYLGGDPALEATWSFFSSIGNPDYFALDFNTLVIIWVNQFAGSDVTGDGKTEATAYKTVPRALNDMALAPYAVNAGFNAPSYSIRFAVAGTYTTPSGGELWESPNRESSYTEIIGFVNKLETIDNADLSALTAVTNKAAQRESTVTGGITTVIGDNDNFILWTYDPSAFYSTLTSPVETYWGTCCRASSDPATKLRFVHSAFATPFAFKEVGQKLYINSYQTVVQGSVSFGNNEVSHHVFGVKFNSNAFMGGTEGNGGDGFWFFGSNQFEGTFRQFTTASAVSGGLGPVSRVKGDMSWSKGRMGAFVSGVFTVSTGIKNFDGLNGAVLNGAGGTTGLYAQGDRADSAEVSFFSGVDFEGTGTAIAVRGGRLRFSSFAGKTRVQNTHNRFIFASEQSWVHNDGGISSLSPDSTAGVPFVLNNASIALGIKASAVANSSVAGQEVTLGASAARTLASLPGTDVDDVAVAASAYQFVRAT